jgi:predicted dehydrogenase
MAIAYAKALQARDQPFAVAGRGQSSAASFTAATGVEPGIGPLSDQLTTVGGVSGAAIVAVGVADLAHVTVQLLGAGFERILLEKPGATTPQEMAELAEVDTDQRIRIAYNRRFLPSVTAAQKLISNDGGAQTVNFEFTELPGRVMQKTHPAQVLDNWALANSSHVMDLAFHLAGADEKLDDLAIAGSVAAGELDWHSPGSRFVGCGVIGAETLFSYSADWMSGGGWAVEVATPKRRLRLRPLEQLTQQVREQFAVEPVPFEHDADGLKPGVPGMLDDFFDNDGAKLPTSKDQARRLAVFDRLLHRTTNVK